ncbi:hypothetical protein [Dysgonomonas termitidis]|uniref:Uncharacterized protein n=1 Tax=Dysgonomonas termitidis TaxID=1516126 RepID=A0ABV9KQ02_9BACT
MKSNELRIGNSILFLGEIVSEIGYGVIQDMAMKEKGVRNEYLDKLVFEPIPLTKDILLKCGLTKHNDPETRYDYLHLHVQGSTARDSSHIRFYIEDNGSIIWKGWIFNQNQVDFFIPYDLKYLHQLQNLYFSLTGEELKVQL